jgi:chromosome segregation ATPase
MTATPKKGSGVHPMAIEDDDHDDSARLTLRPLESLTPDQLDEQREWIHNADPAAVVMATWKRLDSMYVQFGAKVAEYDERRSKELVDRDRIRDEAQQRRERNRDDIINKHLNQVTGALTGVEIAIEEQQNESKKIYKAVTELSNQVLDLTERVNKLERDNNRRDDVIAAMRSVDDETLTKLNALADRVREIGDRLKKD